MNYSSSIFLINDRVRAVAAIYDETERNGSAAKAYLFKTFDPAIAVDDFVVIPTNTRHGMTVAKITAVDVDVDFDSDIQLKWIVARINKAAYDDVLVQEGEAIKLIHSAELRKKKDDLRTNMFANHLDGLKSLPISTLGAPATAAIEPPMTPPSPPPMYHAAVPGDDDQPF